MEGPSNVLLLLLSHHPFLLLSAFTSKQKNTRAMASSTAAPPFSILLRTQTRTPKGQSSCGSRRHPHGSVRAVASENSEGGPPFSPKKAPPGVDTRIHWENPDEGWIGGGKTKRPTPEPEKENNFGRKFADLLKNSTDSHYQFLGVSAEADLEEIKAAYRRLTKEYHPDTTSLPLNVASDKFMHLKEVYDVLSNEESRRFYDWTLAQEAVSRQAERMKMKLEDPYEQDVKNWESVPDMVDRLGGRNMDLGDQATTAITIDVVIIIFAICCVIYVVAFKEPY